MKRLNDWQPRFAAFIEASRARRFEWGAHDCALFAARHVEAITGELFVDERIGAYSGRRGAVAVLRRMGSSLEAAVCSVLGPPIPPLTAMVGDVGRLQSGALAVCNGDHWVAPGAHGLTARPLLDATVAWKVG